MTERGLSLVELLIALSIAAAIMLPLVQMQATAASTATIVRSQLEVQREADYALERIAARVRTAPPALLAPNANGHTTGAWFADVTFEYDSVQLQLLERRNGVGHVLAEPVASFNIAPLNGVGAQPLVKVSLTVAKAGATATAEATVRMGSGI